MSLQQLVGKIGTLGLLDYGNGLRAKVRVVDVKLEYGRPRYVIECVEGEGRATVEASRVKECA